MGDCFVFNDDLDWSCRLGSVRAPALGSVEVLFEVADISVQNRLSPDLGDRFVIVVAFNQVQENLRGGVTS
jgi:hypothetical protein